MKIHQIFHDSPCRPGVSRRQNRSAVRGLWLLLLFCLLLLVTEIISAGAKKADGSCSDAAAFEQTGSSVSVPLCKAAEGVSAYTSAPDAESQTVAAVFDARNGDTGEMAAQELFASYRLEREYARAEQKKLLRELMDDPNSSESSRLEAEERFLQLAADAGQEKDAEQQLSAAGFGESVVLKSSERATVVCAVELDGSSAAQIAEMVSAACCVNFENVVIVNRNMI